MTNTQATTRDATTRDATQDTGTSTTIPETGAPAFPDPRPLFTRAVEIGRGVVAGVRPDQLDLPTPCTEFDVRALTAHIVAVLHRVAVVGAGGDPFDAPHTSSGIADDGWLAAYDERAADIATVWADDAVLTNILTLPWAKLPGAISLMIYISEITVHTWDLARATGQTPVWDDAVLTTAYAAIQQGLPTEGRQEQSAPFDEVVEVPADAPLVSKLVAWTGRNPS